MPERGARAGRGPRRALAVALALGAPFALASLSEVEWTPPGSDMAELRVSWRQPAPIERTCRPPTAAEIEGVPAHMRPAEVCEERALELRVTVVLDGDTVHTAPIGSRGRRARAATVYETFAMPPGERRIEVSIEPDSALEGDGGARASDTLRTSLVAQATAAPGAVVVVTRGADGALAVVDRPRGP